MSHNTLRAMLLTALFAALTAVGAFIRIPVEPTSITLQFFFSALAGILLGLIPSTAAVALLTRRGAGRIRLFLGCLAGDLVLYLFGVPYMYLILHLYTGSDTSMAALLTGMLVYVPGDLVKLAVLTGLSPVLRRRLAGYLP